MSNASGATTAKRVIRDVPITAVGDLLHHPRRATVAFVNDGSVDVLPARARCSTGTHQFAIVSASAVNLDQREVVLLIDAGANCWFELRGFSVRGIAARIREPLAETAPLTWYAIDPQRILAWDYGALREE